MTVSAPEEQVGVFTTVADVDHPRFDPPVFDEMANPLVPITKAHRCERCGAQAYVVSQHTAPTKSGVKQVCLLWCKHHSRAFPALEPFIVRDESNTLHLEEG